MSKIVWDKAGEHFYETGVDRGVLYPTENGVYQNGVPWNGLTSISESPSGAESTAQYADNIKYLTLISAEEFGATVEAFTYPDAFGVCDGSAEPVPGVYIGQQTRRPFGLCYRTLIGNDLQNTDYGYKLHLIYGAIASPSERTYSTVNDSPEAITLSWSIDTTPVDVPGYKPTASLTIDSSKVGKENLAKLEDILYGTDSTEPRLPMPEEVFSLLGASRNIVLKVSSASGSVDGMSVSSLQDYVVVNVDTKTISGDISYVENYTGFSNDTNLQSGNFLALSFEVEPSDATVTAELVGGTSGSYKMKNTTFICRVTNKDTQTIKFSATTGTETNTTIYNLKGLTLATASSLG